MAAGTVPAADLVPPGRCRTARCPDPAAAALALPMPRVDPADPNAGFLAGLAAAAPGELAAALAPPRSTRRSCGCASSGRSWSRGGGGGRGGAMRELEAYVPDDWRVVWYRGVTGLAAGDFEGAALSFDALYDAFPGEPAPKLALGLAAEVLGQADNAAEYYRLVWSRDPGFVGAAFSLARVQWAAGLRQEAVRTLESVPEASIHYTAARVAAIRARCAGATTGRAAAGRPDGVRGPARGVGGARSRRGTPGKAGGGGAGNGTRLGTLR
ncbi:tetratricopeptide repeat protein [Streptomyces sp. S399]|uniref:tetratricopeptide repeat protein n=1 Tax=Streptomyces sp. S399 TaxID=3096009 RepID=UPI002A82368C|nr:tetratricopeptide repeat protein [Streptomyces sp. S399]WPR51118.1 tetratricopeptide repeat protein [Streptomyces sp. S399]